MEDDSLFRNKSNREFITSNKQLNTIINNIENLEPTNCKFDNDNLSFNERKALENLQNNDQIVIKKADKGGSLVIMDTDYYNNHLVLQGHLKSNTYKVVTSDCDKIVMNNLTKHVHNYKECLTDKEIDYLTKFDFKTSSFQVLPKVHKCNSILEIINSKNDDYIEIPSPKDLKSRPIVAGWCSPTHRLSKFLEKLLSPIASIVKTYVKDDWHFL